MDRHEYLTERIQLVLARVEILKLKATNGGYDWGMLPGNLKDTIDETLKEIDELLK